MSKNQEEKGRKTLTRKELFKKDCDKCVDEHGHITYLVVAIRRPEGNIELITNSNGIAEKIMYYMGAYDDNLSLKKLNCIYILKWMVI